MSGKERVGWKWGLEFNGHLHFNTQNSSSRLKGNTKSLFNIVFSLTCWIHGALNKDLPMNYIFSGTGLAKREELEKSIETNKRSWLVKRTDTQRFHMNLPSPSK